MVTNNEPLNIAYGDGKLPLHMDQVYYEGQPGLQLLHCLKLLTLKFLLSSLHCAVAVGMNLLVVNRFYWILILC